MLLRKNLSNKIILFTILLLYIPGFIIGSFYLYDYIQKEQEQSFQKIDDNIDQVSKTIIKDNINQSSGKNPRIYETKIKKIIFDGINISIFNENNTKRIFATSELFNEINLVNKKYESTDRVIINNKKYFFRTYPLNLNNGSNYFINALIEPDLVKVKLDVFSNIIIDLMIVFLIGIAAFVIFLKFNLNNQIKLIVKKADDILTNKLDNYYEPNYKNDTGVILHKLNKIGGLMKQKNLRIDSESIRHEQEIIHEKKELKEEIETIKGYNSQLTDVFMTLIHDIKNPLTVIGGYASTILEYSNFTEEKKREFMKRIVSESDRLTRMTKNFLNILSEERDLDKMTFKEINIDDILKYFYNIYEGKAKERGIKFILDIKDEPLPKIWGNYEKMEFVISNIISNAFKFVLAKGLVQISAVSDGEDLIISITNTGPGIQHGKEKLIFEKYSTMPSPSSKEEGTGLGLYIAKAIIQKHKGEIGVISGAEGGGATFYFKVPIFKK